MKNPHKFIVLIIFFSIISCNKGEITKRPISQTDIFDCYNNSEWNDSKVRDKLIGNWKWIYSESYFGNKKRENTESYKTLIEFFNDATLNITVEGVLNNTTRWTVISKDGELYGIDLESPITPLLNGQILICGEIIEFSNSYIDGDDNYFERVE